MFRRSTPVLSVALVVSALAWAAPALAAETGPQWTVTSVSRPTNFKPGDRSGDDSYRVTVTNTGGADADGEASPIVVTDELPQGLSLDAAGASAENTLDQGSVFLTSEDSFLKSNPFSCVFDSCTYTGVVVPDQTLRLTFPVDVAEDPPASCAVPAAAVSCVTNVVRVSGGGAPSTSMATETTISTTPASFGISPGGASTALSSTQAGAHPDVTTSIAFNTVNAGGSLAGDPKDTIDELPAGFASDFVDTPACPAATFHEGECPVATQVGVVTLTLIGAVQGTLTQPLYNLSPDPGDVAKLGFEAGTGGKFLFEGAFTLRPGDYGATVTFENANQSGVELDNVALTVWGVPAAPIHNPLRVKIDHDENDFGLPSDAALAPFVSNPTFCEATPLEAKFRVTSWEHPNESESPAPTGMPFGPVVGCDRLGMSPELSVEATSSSAYSPTGLNLNMRIPQTYENAEGLATSNLKQAVVTLPEGMTVNPSAGSGLGACTPEQYAEEPIQVVAGAGCPNDSKLGSVRILSPSLKEEATGSVFLAQPYDNPFGSAEHPGGSLLALYIVARIPDRGVLVKAAGEVRANPLTGQLVTTFDTVNAAEPHAGLPPLPFSTFLFSFRQGETSPLVTPPACGSYEVKAALTPWSWGVGSSSTPLMPPIAPFSISSAFDGGPCPSGGLPPFNPQVIAGTEDNDAGSYSPFYIRILRNDGEQEITGFASQLPPGLTANLSGVPFCSEAEIQLAREKTGHEEEADPACPAASEIGHTLVGAGVGSVLAYAPGKIYMAGPFAGAPFSIAAITSADVGPFDLGTVVVHLPLYINPTTAAVSIPAGAANQIPHIIRGIVIHVRDIRVYIDKHNFTLNPTSCNPMRFSATVIGGGADPTNPADNDPVTAASPFQTADCSSLKFAPKFTVTTSGKTSRADGASLTAKLTYPTGSLGQDANIKEVKVDLPKQLPSRLTTLQKACTAAQFNTNPAGCPAASNIGHAKAITPILPVPLEGPVYFVSHGGEAFPSLEIVLQGYGVTIDLVATTFISKAGITSSTFHTIPDQPVTSFEITLPEGKFSALAANGNLCAPTKTVTVKKQVTLRAKGHKRTVTRKVKQTEPEPLAMPTAFTAQNGDTIHQSTPITVSGCSKAHPAKEKAKERKRKGGRQPQRH